MNFLKQLHKLLLGMFALLNGVMLYLFLLHLPYGLEALVLSMVHWSEMDNNLLITAVSFGLAAFIALYAWKMDEVWKNRLLYMRWQFPHPAQDAFLTSRKQPFDSKKLLAAFPQIKDAGFSRVKQTEVWEQLYRKYSDKTVVINTDIHWRILRDIYCLSLMFIPPFAIAWLLNSDMPLSIAATYVFLFGAQFLFLLLAARSIGLKLVDNVLGVSIGMDTDQGSKGKKKA